MLREYKASFEIKGGIILQRDDNIETTEHFIYSSLAEDEEYMKISLENITPEIQERRFNRAKEKREANKLADEGIKNYFKGLGNEYEK